jgi:hypothetical protein
MYLSVIRIHNTSLTSAYFGDSRGCKCLEYSFFYLIHTYDGLRSDGAGLTTCDVCSISAYLNHFGKTVSEEYDGISEPLLPLWGKSVSGTYVCIVLARFSQP